MEKPSGDAVKLREVYSCVALFGKDKFSDLSRKNIMQSPRESHFPGGYCGGGNFKEEIFISY